MNFTWILKDIEGFEHRGMTLRSAALEIDVNFF